MLVRLMILGCLTKKHRYNPLSRMNNTYLRAFLILSTVASFFLLPICYNLIFASSSPSPSSTSTSTSTSFQAPNESSISSKSTQSHTINGETDTCLASFGTYRGSQYRSTASTVGEPKCLIESKWMKLMQHSVQINDNNDNNNNIIDDWLFIDYHDRINVLVQDPLHKQQFIVFNQTKYSLEGRYSLAVVGGIIEPHEIPEHAARREVQEEMNVQCKDMKLLGRFRTDVNRGMGWVYSYLATHCNDAYDDEEKIKDEVGAADTEHQSRLSLSKTELRRRVMYGEFLEVQWSNTVSLALLHLDSL